jgi:acetyl-CoA carboxylase beta subunit
MIFKKPLNALEGNTKLAKKKPSEIQSGLFAHCPRCKKATPASELSENLSLCPYCRHHFRINARQRLNIICDEGSFVETDKELKSVNLLNFPDYDKKLTHARLESAENEAVITGTCEIDKNKTAIFVMEPYFMMGSMGSVVGEKITRLFELASVVITIAVFITLSK